MIFRNLKLEIRNSSGIAALPVILLIGGIIIEVAITGVLLFYYLNTNLADTRLSNDALVMAQTGIEDALLRIARNKDCPNISCTSPYDITSQEATARITICKDSCAGAGKTQITSLGRSRNKEHTIVAIASINTTTGQVTIDSIKEL